MSPCCARNIWLVSENLQREIAALKADKTDGPEPLRVALAERDAALALVEKLLKRIDKHGGYSTSKQQEDVREAKAMIAERSGR